MSPAIRRDYGQEVPRAAHCVSPKWVSAGGELSRSWKNLSVIGAISAAAACTALSHCWLNGARSASVKRASLISKVPGRIYQYPAWAPGFCGPVSAALTLRRLCYRLLTSIHGWFTPRVGPRSGARSAPVRPGRVRQLAEEHDDPDGDGGDDCGEDRCRREVFGAA